MKYPYVIFFRYNKYSYIDNLFIENNDKLNFTIFLTNNIEVLNNLYNSNYQILITFGNDISEYNTFLSKNPKRIKNKWIHINEINNIDDLNNLINMFFIEQCSLNRQEIRPIFSIFTTTYNSYHKIKRAYNSLISQTFKDWEFVVVDDSPDDNHFIFLKELMNHDSRVRLFRRNENCGNIGNVKNEAISLTRGKYVIELDHDDELMPYVLHDSFKVFEENPEIGFIYMDCAFIYENGQNFQYGDFICKGYGSHYLQKYNDKWLYVYNTPNINNITLSHLVCCPNHPRIWRKNILTEIGNYCELLPICDDYEILLRTALNTIIAKIHKLGYIQYMNNDNNNFSLIRNNEINRIGPSFIFPFYFNKFKINEYMQKINAYEDESYIYNYSKIWERDDTYVHKYCNSIVNCDYNKQYCILGFDSFLFNKDYIINMALNNKNDFIIIDFNCDFDYLKFLAEIYKITNFKLYHLTYPSYEAALKYFHLQYKSCKNFEIVSNYKQCFKFNTNLNNRYEVINFVSSSDNNYLQIGIDDIETFENTHFINKKGIHELNCYDNKHIIVSNSNDYFKNYSHLYDIIFIDGLHHCQQIITDFNNSINNLNKNGTIILDDIIPFHHDEQMKMPISYTYTNNSLISNVPWTGEVWKVAYYILSKFKTCISFSIFHNINYRGIGCFKINDKFLIQETELELIQNYSYDNDFENYIKILLSIIE